MEGRREGGKDEVREGGMVVVILRDVMDALSKR